MAVGKWKEGVGRGVGFARTDLEGRLAARRLCVRSNSVARLGDGYGGRAAGIGGCSRRKRILVDLDEGDSGEGSG